MEVFHISNAFFDASCLLSICLFESECSSFSLSSFVLLFLTERSHYALRLTIPTTQEASLHRSEALLLWFLSPFNLVSTMQTVAARLEYVAREHTTNIIKYREVCARPALGQGSDQSLMKLNNVHIPVSMIYLFHHVRKIPYIHDIMAAGMKC